MNSMELTARERLVLETLEENNGGASEMLTADQLRHLHDDGVTIGSHGMSHTPIPLSLDPAMELRESRAALRGLVGVGETSTLATALSFPHGVHNEWSIRAAQDCGYRVLFTSESGVIDLREGQAIPAVLGRVHIYEHDLADASGKFCAELLACWLFSQDSAEKTALSAKRGWRRVPIRAGTSASQPEAL
jgi:peptidoglycan/xylan/chitin deacetylase (PgdA/CDA1 family)